MDWIIDGIPIIQTHPSRRLDFNAVLINLLWEVKLTVPAIEDNNNTRVQCRAIGDGSILDSNPAVFKIQGWWCTLCACATCYSQRSVCFAT